MVLSESSGGGTWLEGLEVGWDERNSKQTEAPLGSLPAVFCRHLRTSCVAYVFKHRTATSQQTAT